MMWKEFETLAGYEVSYEDYANIIEPMYMATDLSKQDFIKCIDRKHFAVVPRTEKDVIREMKKEVKKLFEIWGLRRDHETESKLEELAREYERRFWNGKEMWCYLHKEYEYPGMRGCSLPTELVLMGRYGEVKRVVLIKIA